MNKQNQDLLEFDIIPKQINDIFPPPIESRLCTYLWMLCSNHAEYPYTWVSDNRLVKRFGISLSTIKRALTKLKKKGFIHCVTINVSHKGRMRRIYRGRPNKLLVDISKAEMKENQSDLPPPLIQNIPLNEFIDNYVSNNIPDNLVWYVENEITSGYHPKEIKTTQHWLNILNAKFSKMNLTEYGYELGKNPITVSTILSS